MTRSDDGTTAFEAVAGRKYRISVGCFAAADGEAFKCFEPYELRIGTEPPPG